MSLKVSYKDFKIENIIFGKEEESNTTDNAGNKIKYYRIPIQYNYDIVGDNGQIFKSRGELCIEGPEEISRGPQTSEFKNKNTGVVEKTVHSILTQYDLSKQEHNEFVNRTDGTIHKLYMKCVSYVFQNKGNVGITSRSEDGMMDLFYYPIKWKIDDKTNEPVPGVNPAGIWKLFRYGKANYTKETAFYMVGAGTKIPWEMISHNKIKHKPLFRISNITIAGSRPTLKIDVLSSVVLDILPGEGPNKQQDVINSVSADSEIVAKLKETLRQKEAELEKTREQMSSMSLTPPSVENQDVPMSVIAPAQQPLLMVPGISQQMTPVPVVLPAAIPAPVVTPAPAPISLESLLATPPPMAPPAALPIPGLNIPGVNFSIPPLA
jgi:hypothetical protein